MKQASLTGFNAALSIALVLLASACSKEGASCFEGRGEQDVEIRSLETFNHLYVEGRLEVHLIADSSNYAELSYGENGLGGIVTEVASETLSITEVNRCDWNRKVEPLPRIYVHYTHLQSLFLQSAGTTEFNVPYQGDSLRIEIQDASGSLIVRTESNSMELFVHTGGTDVQLLGRCNDLYIYNSGYAPVHAETMESQTVSVHNNHLGHTHVRALNHLYYQIYHRGNVYLYGNAPATPWHVSGGGLLVRK